MKILVGVASGGKGGVESYILQFTEVCHKHNISVDVLTTNIDESYKSKLNKLDADLVVIDNLHNKDKITSKIFNLQQKNHYDGAYWNISTAIMYPYVKASVDCGIKNVVVHSHAHYNSRPNLIQTKIFDFMHWYYQKKLSNLPVKFAGCSTQAAHWLAGTDRILAKDWTFVPNPIDVEACTFNKELRDQKRIELNVENNVVIGVATAFMPYKNPLFLVTVFSEILKLIPEAKLLIAGTGPMEEELKKKASSELPKTSYEFLGYRKDVSELLQAFDAYVLPSKNEGLPLAILEAQAAGLPCVMANTITEEAIVIKNLVRREPLNKPKLWARAVMELLAKNDTRSKECAKIVSDNGFKADSPKTVLPLFGVSV